MRRLPLVLLALVACSNNGKPCKLHSDCAEIERCVGGTCTIICRVDRDCEGLGQCLQGQCVLVTNGGGEGGGGGAAGGAAGGTAGGNAGGVAGGAAGGTAGGTAGGAAGGTAGGSAGGTAGGSAGGTAGGAAGGTAGGGTGGGLGQFGDACMGASQCQSNLCLGLISGTQGICTISCADESVCLAGMACIAISGTKVCVPSDSGHPCPNGSPANCFAGICVGTGSTSVCATPCDSTRACPTTGNFTCSPVGGVNGRVCIPAGGPCMGHGASTACSSAYCEGQAQNLNDGICTNLCRDRFDCPPTWGCGLDDDGTVQHNTISVCQPVGSTCSENAQSMNDCYSQTCAIATGTTGYCTALCMNTSLQPEPARCPPGYTCTAETSMGQTVYACESP